jgi:carboxyl-terminal processing protease
MRFGSISKAFLPFLFVFLLAVIIQPPRSHAQQSSTAPPSPQEKPSVPGTPPSSDSAAPTSTPPISNFDKERALGILDNVSKGIQEHYYDPKLNGLDWNAVIEKAKVKIENAKNLNDALAQVAVAVSYLNDSHTFYFPPERPYHLDYGFDYQMIWSRCFVTRVRPGSDAATKGLRPGDEILSLDGVAPTRQNLWGIRYLYETLEPEPGLSLEVQTPGGEKQKLAAMAKVTQESDLAYRPGASIWYDLIRKDENESHRLRMRLAEVNKVAILKFPIFEYSADQFYELGAKVRKDNSMIVDLRGNPGGLVETLKQFIGMFFDHDIKLCDRVERKKTETEMAKGEKHNYFSGKVIVLVDSESASASEIFARVMQLEKRATVMGDRTSGAVMMAEGFPFSSGGVDYGAQITIANLIMTDGKSLEHQGVMPDDLVFPQPEDLAKGRDPVLAKAAAELGVPLTPEVAGALFPYEWPKD